MFPSINTFSEVSKPLFDYRSPFAYAQGLFRTLKLVTVKLPEKLISDVDQLVKAGIYHNRSDAIRAAVRDLLRRELWRPETG